MHWSEHGPVFHLTLGGPEDRDDPGLEALLARVMERAAVHPVAMLVRFQHSTLSPGGLRMGLTMARSVGQNLAAVAVISRSLRVRVACSWLAMELHPRLPRINVAVFEDEAAAGAWLERGLADRSAPEAPRRRTAR